MSEPIFKKGDLVTIRPFDQIDVNDIGFIHKDNFTCYSITKNFIDAPEAQRSVFRIYSVSRCKDANTYSIRNIDPNGFETGYSWAQGMLYPYYADELPDCDPDELFAGLFPT